MPYLGSLDLVWPPVKQKSSSEDVLWRPGKCVKSEVVNGRWQYL